MLTIPQLKDVASRDPYLYEALKRIVGAVNALNERVGVDPTGAVAAPPAIRALAVSAANGMFEVAITDVPPSQPALIWYFVDYDTSPAFANPKTEFLGPARNKTLALGNQTLYWRAYSQYLSSPRSAYLSYGTPPIGVAGGGSAPPPAQPPQGSGIGGGGGFGRSAGGRRIVL